jgi:beta-lactamase class A
MRMRAPLIAGFAATAIACLPSGGAFGADLTALKADIERVAKATGGRLGVGLRHVETGEELYFNRAERFPMGSLFKVPLAVEVLARVEQGSLSLDQPVAIRPADLRPGSGKLKAVFGGPPPMPVRQLLETMLVDSDNTATDLLWKEAGGAPAVAARLAGLGVKGLQVARPTGELLAAASGLSTHTAGQDVTPTRLDALLREHPRETRRAEIAAFLADERDTTTPQAYVALLDRIWRGKALGAQQTAYLLDVMKRCATGSARLRAGLPAGALLAHKTGTLRPLAANDAGIVALPGGRGHLVVVVLVRGSPRDLAGQERAIADVAKAAYARFSE